MDVIDLFSADILNSILDTSKVESGKMQLEEAEFSMADVLQESVDMANVTGVRRGVEVIWDPCDFSVLRCAAVLGDSKRLKQILDNLLGNALKFTDEGHVVLRGWATRPIAGSGAALRQGLRTQGAAAAAVHWHVCSEEGRILMARIMCRMTPIW